MAAFGAIALSLGCSSDPLVSPDFQAKLETAPQDSLATLIDDEATQLGVTALSVTIHEAGGESQTLYFGRAKAGGLMQVASLSKTVAAAVILTLARQEEVGLDDDIRSQITSLDVAGLEGGDRPVTLRQLLSHTTGASQSGYPGYARGGDLPTAVQVVANPPRVFESTLVFDGEPGQFRYSGGGYIIAQVWAEDVSGKTFADLARETLFDPLGMEDSTFLQPIEDAEIAPLTIVGADASFDLFDGVFASIEDSWHDYPEQAAAGLWTTSNDYARFVIALMDAASGVENVIPSDLAKAMITPQVALEEGKHYGLGTQLVLHDDGSLRFVSHSGANTGYRAFFSARPATQEEPRRVVVSIANTVSGAKLNEAIVFALTDQ
ncbi:serine hydrolase domain-containing protein [Qipengyuania sp. DGS5-3]|uniref:serine hydrolase domain-containing protein n=1 Tax=Qipengyuania sp. DGS5-3 TaxID=3349632 RepID=UPI0036D342B2